jgi:hypothetical protein
MKKYILIAIIVGIIFAGGLYGVKKYTTPPAIQTNSSISAITVVLNTGEEISTASGIQADNAFVALQSIAKQKNLELKTKQYDFGVFVEAIGTLANTKEKSWIYFVNGKSGEVASDKYEVKQNDIVEWKYTMPIY